MTTTCWIRSRSVLDGLVALLFLLSSGIARAQTTVEYRVLVANEASTLQKKMQRVSEAGFRFAGVTSGAIGIGQSAVVVMTKRPGVGTFEYRVLGTTRASTLQSELQAASDVGFDYKGDAVFRAVSGKKETIAIMERASDKRTSTGYEYRVLATRRMSTMEKELREAYAAGFEFVGLTTSHTLVGAAEVVSILRRTVR
jgi:hypothetical protein